METEEENREGKTETRQKEKTRQRDKTEDMRKSDKKQIYSTRRKTRETGKR